MEKKTTERRKRRREISRRNRWTKWLKRNKEMRREIPERKLIEKMKG